MGLFEAIKDVLADEGTLGETANKVVDAVCECGHSIADALETFSESLGETESPLAAEGDGEEPDWDASPHLRALKDASDSIVSLCNKATYHLNIAVLKSHIETVKKTMGGDDDEPGTGGECA